MKNLSFYQCIQLVSQCIAHGVLKADPNDSNCVIVYRAKGENSPEGWYSEAVFAAAGELMGDEEGRNILLKELEKRGVPFACDRIPGFLS